MTKLTTYNTGTSVPTTKTIYAKPVYPHAHLPVLTDMDVPSTILMQTLYRALSVRRAGDSVEEAQFVAWLANRLPVTMVDAAGNVHVDTRKGPQHRTMFTAHTDTVHHHGGRNEIRLDVQADKTLWRAGEGACLGADDGAGIALMMHMLDAGVPGYYVFFRGEESGGIGSSWLAGNMPGCLQDVDRCVSFDRADYSDVITHQAGERCCSDAFAQALADQLTTDDLTLAYMPDATGVFTDSANLTRIVAECTNLSVGYKHQHGDGEWQDVTFLQRMADQLVRVQWDDLPVERDPKVREPRYARSKPTATYDDIDYKDWWKDSFADHLGHEPKSALPAWAIGGRSHSLDDFEEYVVDALYAAADEDYAALRGIAAEHLLPDDPEMARKHIDTRKLTSQQYADYAQGIDNGEYDTVDVLDTLVELLYTE